MRPRAALFATLAVVCLMMAAPAHASDPWDDVEVVEDDALADMRGGFKVGGIEVGFGATVTTYANGMMAMQTQLTWTDAGLVAQQTLGELGQKLESMTPEQRAALGLEGLSGGVVIADEAGVTALVHNVTEGALQNIVLNTASGRDLGQHVDVTLTLPGFEAVQEGLGLELFGLRLNDDLTGMLIGAP